jgi:hypothetical protein
MNIYLGIFSFSWIENFLKINLIIRWTCVEMAKVFRSTLMKIEKTSKAKTTIPRSKAKGKKRHPPNSKTKA